MLPEQKQQLAQWIAACANELIQAANPTGGVPPVVPQAVSLDRPKQASHGDIACNLALQLAKPLKLNPRALAEQLAGRLPAFDTERWIEAIEIAGPGFLNLRLSAAAKRAVVPRVLAQAGAFGRNQRGAQRKVLVEFVSANPTGPLHVGHGRQGALGDSLAALLQANGYQVMREFYYNDAGAQINNLALSVQARARGIAPDDPAFPADGYRGEYIADIARDFLARKSVAAEHVAPVTASGDVEDLDSIRRFAVAYLRHEQDLDLQAFGVHFDNYYLESSLYSDGKVDATVRALIDAGKTFEEGGALWLRSTEFGDDKDRVMRKSDGGYTYFVPDVAYHITKWQRGFGKVINVQGSDHHGTIARVRAGLQAGKAGIPDGYPDYVLHKMVTVMKGGQEVKISKRAGSYVTLRDLIEWSGGIGSSAPDSAPAGDAPAGNAPAGNAAGGQPATDPSDTEAPGTVAPSTEAPSTEQMMQRGRDAVRFFLISRKADTEFVFDVDLAVARSDENPVYYVQYAHARICSVFARSALGTAPLFDPQLAQQTFADVDLGLLAAPREASLMARLAQYPELLATACDELAPHSIAFYLKDLASELHSYYNAEKVLVEDAALQRARLSLLAATRQVLANGLELLGVSAPERM